MYSHIVMQPGKGCYSLIPGPTTDVYSLGQMLWHMLTNEKAGIFSEKTILRGREESNKAVFTGEN